MKTMAQKKDNIIARRDPMIVIIGNKILDRVKSVGSPGSLDALDVKPLYTNAEEDIDAQVLIWHR